MNSQNVCESVLRTSRAQPGAHIVSDPKECGARPEFGWLSGQSRAAGEIDIPIYGHAIYGHSIY